MKETLVYTHSQPKCHGLQTTTNPARPEPLAVADCQFFYEQGAMAYLALEKLHALYDGYRRCLRLGGREYLLLQEGEHLYLLANRCPHREAPLHKASVQQDILRCPMHGIEFDLRTGHPLGAAAACVAPLEFIPLVYHGNTVGVEV